MKKYALNIVLTITLSGLALSANATLPTYTFTDLGSQGGSSSSASAINNVGQVVGYSTYQYNAIIWNGTTATELSGNYANAINNAGQVAGTTNFSGNYYGMYNIATVWNGTTTTYLNSLGGNDTYAFAINDAGQVAGSSNLAGNNTRHATIWNGTTVTDLGTLPGGNGSDAYAINNAGQVAGYSQIAFGSHATLWNGTRATDLGTLGGINSTASAINDSGQVVGYSTISGNAETHATIWNGIVAKDLNSFLDASTVSAGWVLNSANGINDSGWIVGSASNSLLGVTNHAFVMSVAPVPEPDSYAMILMGVGLMGFIVRHRKNEQTT